MAEEMKKMIIENDTNQALWMADVGRFEPGETAVELTPEQVELVKSNNVLKLKDATETKPAAPKPPVKE